MSKWSDDFRPWAGDIRWGLIWATAGLAAMYAAFGSQSLYVGAAGTAVTWFGMNKLRRGLTRRRGKTIEVRSIRRVDFPKDWKAQPSKRVHTGGDIDLYVEAPGGAPRFAIEIKSIESIRVKSTWFGFGDPKFVSASGRPLKIDPVPQTMRNAAAVDAVPVLWLPNGDYKTIRLKSGLIIVQGGRRALLRAVGAKPWWHPF